MSHPRVHNMRGSYPGQGVRVDRKTWWGNPYDLRTYGRSAMRLYLDWLRDDWRGWLRIKRVGELAGKDLLCWCAPGPCHAEVLARLADGEDLEAIRADLLLRVEGPEQRTLFKEGP